MTNDELKALYEKYPWAWEVQRQCRHTTSAWGTDHCSTFGRGFNPAGLAEPGRESVLLSLFEPKEREAASTGGSGQPSGGFQDDQDVPF